MIRQYDAVNSNNNNKGTYLWYNEQCHRGSL